MRRMSLFTLPVWDRLPKLAPHHFRFASSRAGLFHDMVSLLRVVEYELAGWEINVHIGWPMSSWLDRLAIGVMVFNLIRLPRLFPHFNFEIRYHRHSEGIINGEINSTQESGNRLYSLISI